MKLNLAYFNFLEINLLENFSKTISNPKEILILGRELLSKSEDILAVDCFKKLTAENSICYLDECNFCIFDREITDIRSDLEDIIISNISSMNKDKFINYTSLGAGDLFSDLVILTKITNLGYKKINVSLIDYNFTEYINDLKNNSNDINFENKSDQVKIKTYQLIQFLNWFSEFEDISFSIYSGSNSYIRECQNDTSLKSDIVLAIDILDEKYNSLNDYNSLLTNCLKDCGIGFSLYHEINTDNSIREIHKNISNTGGINSRALLKNFEIDRHIISFSSLLYK